MNRDFQEALIEFALLAGLCAVAALLSRGRVKWRWLGTAGLVFAVYHLASSQAYGYLPRPDFIDSPWNWEGYIWALLALAALTLLLFARSPAEAGLTVRQCGPAPRAAAVLSILLLAVLAYAATRLPGSFDGDWDTIAFQASMPSLAEEWMYRGLLLVTLDRAFGTPLGFLGPRLGWGAVIAAAMFGAAHLVGWDEAGLVWNWAHAGYTGAAGLLVVWIRAASGSLVWPVAVHGGGNAVFYIL